MSGLHYDIEAGEAGGWNVWIMHGKTLTGGIWFHSRQAAEEWVKSKTGEIK